MCRTMEIEELKVNINYWEKENGKHNQQKILDIARNELDRKSQERKLQIELLTKSLTSSSRRVRWLSSIKAIIKQFI